MNKEKEFEIDLKGAYFITSPIGRNMVLREKGLIIFFTIIT